MNYPKPLMSISELTELGFSRDYLKRIVHHKQAVKFANRTSRGGKFIIDTEEFEKLRKRGILI
ncbi:hypothetical protein [Parasporobacterium paucivorans]|uniref:Helix-turn-helix domain-containing protein n=1 Tax=Parasporobacterium paucivorans DSM 15970 TaxID=1122934 RepID=A0A1M6B7M0_9FIRM|nr:hypothetical protein [Parasporobacterium paucivorans]SHI44578.1 hypothetical protein SAMN02745691_00278 [Parasporobacterium paucivorans DSM 15970]